MIEFNQIGKDYNKFVADTDSFIKEQKRKAIKDKVEEYIESYIEDECYNNGWEGYQSTRDRLYEKYIGRLETEDNLVEEILEESGVGVCPENKKLVIELAKEV